MTCDPYLMFNGRAEEAINFYKSVLKAKVNMLFRCKDAPESAKPAAIPAGGEEKIMHASIRIGETNICMSDGYCTGHLKFEGFSLSVTVESEDEAEHVFAGLAEKGKVMTPLSKTFFSPKFGVVVDQFGVSWMVMLPAN